VLRWHKAVTDKRRAARGFTEGYLWTAKNRCFEAGMTIGKLEDTYVDVVNNSTKLQADPSGGILLVLMERNTRSC